MSGFIQTLSEASKEIVFAVQKWKLKTIPLLLRHTADYDLVRKSVKLAYNMCRHVYVAFAKCQRSCFSHEKNDRKSNFLILATDHAVADVLLRT